MMNLLDSIQIEREAIVADAKMSPRAVIQSSNGGFIVMGSKGRARAVGTDANGTVIWDYMDPDDGTLDQNHLPNSRSTFFGAAPLASGKYLFCGEKYSKLNGYEVNEITILDNYGGLVEKRVELSSAGERLLSSSFRKCVPWEGGFLLTGYAHTVGRTRSYLWIVKLDQSGAKQWDRLVDVEAPIEVDRNADRSFVYLTLSHSLHEVSVMRVSEKGVITDRRLIKGETWLQLAAAADSKQTRVIVYEYGKPDLLYNLDERLNDAKNSAVIETFLTDQGSGYALPDGSLLLFGRQHNAAIARMTESGHIAAVKEFSLKYPSFTVDSAVQLTSNQFVTVRQSVSQSPNGQGLVMSWVTLQ